MPYSLSASLRTLSVLALAGSLALSGCGGGGGGVTPMATSTPVVQNLACPTSGSVPSSVAMSAQSAHRLPPSSGATQYVPGQLAVSYSASAAPGDSIDGEMSTLHGKRVGDLQYGHIGMRMRVVSVDPSQEAAAIAKLRALPGVQDVVRVSYRQRMSITANDPYYVGFPGTIAPYYESSSVPGQWDMHAIKLDGAWSQFSSAPIVAAPIAIVDTGVDVTHPELKTPSGVPAPKITRSQCYVTYPSSSTQTSGPYVTDTDGHGTNVTGIADGDTNNSFAFAGVAFDAPLLAYRIFPTDPSGGCENSTSPQCEASSADEASAINDAVNHGAKVINLSLGTGGPCASTDPEYVAVENAIKAGVVVVAAAGNGTGNPAVGQPVLDCPAADPGVIAVGATSLNDSNPLNVFEYVASYSNFVTNNGTANGGAYLVAPGGDPCSGSTASACNDQDNLHWIEHIYSSTAAQAGQCASTPPANESNDCRILIAGTSQATPHVVGVVSLMLAKNPNLTPTQIATGLCQSADSIGDAKQGCGRVNAAAAVTWAATH